MSNISFVLIETSHTGNIGSAARAMKNMGFEQLILVNPKSLPDDDSYALAAGATDILDKVKVVNSLDEAIAQHQVIFGCSARQRSLEWPMLALPQASELIMQQQKNDAQIAILFGSERTGLSNEMLQRCHYHLYIPSNPEYPSLNLAQAVQVVAYALSMASPNNYQLEQGECEQLASTEEFEHFYANLMNLIAVSGFASQEPNTKMTARLRRLFQRAQMRKSEIDILQGILRKTLFKLKKLHLN